LSIVLHIGLGIYYLTFYCYLHIQFFNWQTQYLLSLHFLPKKSQPKLRGDILYDKILKGNTEMESNKTKIFSAKIEIIGLNPFVYLPDNVLKSIFIQVNKDKGKIPVKIKIDGHEFPQTLIKYSGQWRLYLNTPMRKSANKDVGEKAKFEIWYDSEERIIPAHPKFIKALKENKEAKKIFDGLRPSLQLEIVRYLSFLKTDESLNRNVMKAVNFLLGKQKFIGRDKP
jgi:hypothetical protein